MKNRYLTLRGAMLLCIAAIVSLPSCDWFSEDPLWIGKWQYKDKIYVGDITYNTTTTLTLNESSFEEVYIITRDNSSEITSLLGLKGSLSVKNDIMTFTLSAVGECVEDAQQKCTSVIEWFPKGSATYNTYMQYLKETVTGEFEAEEDWLWLVRDRNKDGDTEDDGEDIEFERL
jgi:hypothetical protein